MDLSLSSSICLSAVAPVDHVRLKKWKRPIFSQVSSTPQEDETRQPLPHRSDRHPPHPLHHLHHFIISSLASSFSPPSCSWAFLHFSHSLCRHFHHRKTSVSAFSRHVKSIKQFYGHFSQASNTHNLFYFCHNTSDSPPTITSVHLLLRSNLHVHPSKINLTPVLILTTYPSFLQASWFSCQKQSCWSFCGPRRSVACQTW